MAITPEAQPTLKLNIREMKVNGSDSCNTFMGSIETLTDKKLVFGDLASTLMLCAEKMEVTDAFGMAMQKVRQYQLKGDQLLLTDKQGGVLLTFAKKQLFQLLKNKGCAERSAQPFLIILVFN